MRRGILLISSLVAGMILILSAAMLSYIFRHSDTKGLNVINSAGGRDRHQPPPNTKTSAALEENKNIGSIGFSTLSRLVCCLGLISDNTLIFY